ncbi:MAG: lycopene cyclase family protein [Bacteroidetes bacterium]|nr:lycopene cyclase family protein [Bacteroidota bacterium]
MPNTENVDIVICGGGCSAMLLLYYLQQYPDFSKMTVLVIEKETVYDNKTWCFWHDTDHSLQHLISNTWHQVQFADKNFSSTQAIKPYSYSSIKGKDFYDYFLNQLIPELSNVKIIKDEVCSIQKYTGGSSKVICNKGIYIGSKVYSSIIDKQFYTAPIFIWQHFKGWHIKTDTDVFDRDTITLMDFKNCSANSCDFIYVLPYSNNEALIEFTAFSPEVWSDHAYQLKFDQYANMHLKGINFSIIGAEQGTIPMVDYKHSATGSGGQILIGTAAGKIKATSGYGFEKMRADAQILSAQFFKQPIVRQKTKNRFKFYDKLLLKVILEDPQEAVRIFGQLFNKIPFPLILKFLYEETNLYQEALIFSKLPFLPFIKRV